MTQPNTLHQQLKTIVDEMREMFDWCHEIGQADVGWEGFVPRLESLLDDHAPVATVSCRAVRSLVRCAHRWVSGDELDGNICVRCGVVEENVELYTPCCETCEAK